jgi:hypothetical protein
MLSIMSAKVQFTDYVLIAGKDTKPYVFVTTVMFMTSSWQVQEICTQTINYRCLRPKIGVFLSLALATNEGTISRQQSTTSKNDEWGATTLMGATSDDAGVP